MTGLLSCQPTPDAAVVWPRADRLGPADSCRWWASPHFQLHYSDSGWVSNRDCGAHQQGWLPEGSGGMGRESDRKARREDSGRSPSCARMEKPEAYPTGPLNSRKSQARASLQSRMTVSGETFNTTAVSSTLRPPKNRSSMTRALRESTAASALSASSSAISSLPRRDERSGISSRLTRG